MFEPTDEEIAEAHARARERIAVRADAKLPVLDHDQTVADALRVLAAEKAQVAYAHWMGRIWHRWHRRVERRIERKLGRPFRFSPISGLAVQRRWLRTLGTFVRLDIERRFGPKPISLADVRRAFRDERIA